MDMTAPHFHDEQKAREYLEATRWPDGPVCPHCGNGDNIYRLEGSGGEKGTKARRGTLKCGACRKQFSVTVGTVFERSKVPLHKWLLATYLLCSSKKGISSHQLHRTLGVTYKTAWFMAHRIREAMREPVSNRIGGGGGAVVEVDETYIGGREKHDRNIKKRKITSGPLKGQYKRGVSKQKEKVITLVERGGKARSFHVTDVNAETLRPIIWHQLSPRTTLMTDEAGWYKTIGRGFDRHESVNHSAKEYVRGDAYTNTVEGYFSILKRGIYGVYQHVSREHLKRYLGEFDFRYTHREATDSDRTLLALAGIDGKRLLYRDSLSA